MVEDDDTGEWAASDYPDSEPGDTPYIPDSWTVWSWILLDVTIAVVMFATLGPVVCGYILTGIIAWVGAAGIPRTFRGPPIMEHLV